MNSRRLKILIAKVGLDGHDRGAKILCRFLRDAGMEVIYTGIRQTAAAVANIALQEDVDLIGISILSGAHNILIPQLLDELSRRNLDLPILVGGIIPQKDVQFLLSKGVKKIYSSGIQLSQIAQDIRELYAGRLSE